jgi:hypothetical protein
MAKSWYCPGPTWTPASAVQTTAVGASVIVVPSRSTGSGRAPRSTTAVHPGSGLVRTEVSGVSVGSSTGSATVPAVSDSVGTRKVSWVKPPAVVDSGRVHRRAGAGRRRRHPCRPRAVRWWRGGRRRGRVVVRAAARS